MFSNYLKIALRNFLKFKGYAAINIFGLAIGIACALLILQHVRYELRYDQHHTNLDRLYRVSTQFSTADSDMKMAVSPSPLAWTLVNDYPEVEAAARMMKTPGTEQYLIKYEDQSFFEKDGIMVDSTFFQVLTYDFIEGDPRNAVDEPYQVVISTEISKKLFGNNSALGKEIKIADQWGEDVYKVTGVINPSSYPTHIAGNFFMNMRSGNAGRLFYNLQEWAGNNLYNTYIRLSPNASPEVLEAKLPALVEEKAGERLKNLGFQKVHHLEAVSSIYLTSDFTNPNGPLGDISFLYIFGAIAVFILLIACINFMNLSTAKATIRSQEVGVRKVVGATRRMLSSQFLTEAAVYTFISLLVALFLAQISLPFFNEFSGKEISLNLFQDKTLWLWIGGILGFTALIAGSYPALYLSSFSPVNIFRGKTGKGFSAKQIRRGLVVVQFIVSIALIQGIIVINQQMNYTRTKKLGFSTDAKIVFPLNTTNAAQNYELIKQQFSQNPKIKAIGATSAAPGMSNVEDMLTFGEGQPEGTAVHTMRHFIDSDYLPLMKFELIKGRIFDKNRIADTVNSIVINEKLMHSLGYNEENVLGKKMYWNWDGTLNTHRIIGLVKDFHDKSLRREVDNHAFFWVTNNYSPSQLIAEIETSDISGTLADLKQRWATVNNAEPFEYFFLDDKLQQAYESDQKTAKMIFIFTLLAIIISCLGLFGLAAFAAESRMKEISVRKVLGATPENIIGLLSKDFLLLVIFAIIIASPIAFYFLDQWLQEFRYRIEMPWWAFIAAGFVAIVITFITVSFQGIKAALVNPAERLKSE